MSFADSSPDGSEFGVFLKGLGLEDVSNSLSEVEACSFVIIDILDLQQSVLFVLISLASFKAHKCSFLVQSRGRVIDGST